MGKTGLIHHVFQEMKSDCLYLDILHTATLQEFTITFGKAAINQLESPIGKTFEQFTTIFKRLKPSITFYPVSGQPAFDLTVGSEKEAENTLEDIFNYLKKRKKKATIAIDEFRQISFIRKKNGSTPAILHTKSSSLFNSFFCGSSKHILTAMFSQASRPFYQSTQFLFLDHNTKVFYVKFISNHFIKFRKTIEPSLVEEILEWSKLHTYYAQLSCHNVFSKTEKKATRQLLSEIKEEIFKEK